jgi:hypothetical protein
VLSLVRRHGSLSKTDIARMTSLSAQTASVIMRKLEEDGLLERGEPLRGKIGQPSIPMSLNPEGALFPRPEDRPAQRRTRADRFPRLRCAPCAQLSYRLPYPAQHGRLRHAGDGGVSAPQIDPPPGRRIAGLGIAMPFELWNWAETAGAPRDIMEQWRNLRHPRRHPVALCPFPVYLQNDATSACGAELVFGQIGGCAISSISTSAPLPAAASCSTAALCRRHSGNAGCARLDAGAGPGRQAIQLIDIASLAVLEKALNAAARMPTICGRRPRIGATSAKNSTTPGSKARERPRLCMVSASSVIDFEAAIIDGWMPVEAPHATGRGDARAAMAEDRRRRPARCPAIREGTVGIHARALGGASLPLSERFLHGAGTGA